MAVLSKKKEISEQVSLQARGLFVLANMHYREMRRAEGALAKLLGYGSGADPYCDCLSDEIYQGEKADFDEAMRKEAFVTRKKAKAGKEAAVTRRDR